MLLMFKLNFDIPASEKKIGLNQSILSIGSCFSENIGHKLSNHKFRCLSNPFGTLFNPISIFKNLAASIADGPDDRRIHSHNDLSFHWDNHSQFYDSDPERLLDTLASVHNKVAASLKEVKWIIVTLGTAWVHELKQDHQVVANCHKHPKNHFHKRILNQGEILTAFYALQDSIKEINGDVQWVFTLSPVRHTKEGLVANNHSKSILLDSIHQLVQQDERVSYFPSFEIMQDELRDYRFYKEDMIHPSNQAIDYIWDRFANTFFDEKTLIFIDEWQSIRNALGHRPLQEGSDEHQKFLHATINKLLGFEDIVDIKQELQILEEQLHP